MNRRRWMALSCALITLALVVGGASIPAAAYTPIIYGVTPSDGATGVSKNTDIVIKWRNPGAANFYPVLVDPTGGPNTYLIKYRDRYVTKYDPFGNIIESYIESSCYPRDASNNRISLASDTQYNVALTSTYDWVEHIISSFTTGSQSTPTWSGWQSMGGQLLAGTGPAACNWGSGHTAWFVTGTNHALYYKTDETDSSGWENLGGYLTSSPAASSSGNGVIDVGARGLNGALYTRHYSGGSWGAWTNLGGQLLAGTGPAACTWRFDNTAWFVTGTNHALYNKTDETDSSWTSLGGYLTSSPAATSEGPYVCARGSNGALYRTQYGNGGVWAPWMSLGGQLPAGTSPTVCSWPGRIDIFVRGTNGALYHKWWDIGWGYSGWESQSGYVSSSPGATSPSSGVINVGVRGSNGALWWNYCQDGSSSTSTHTKNITKNIQK